MTEENKSLSNELEDISKPIEITEFYQTTIPSRLDVVKNDALIKGLLNDDGIFDLVSSVLVEMAEEGASLKYERMKLESENRSTDRVSVKRAQVLKMIMDALVQRRTIALNDFVNLKSPQWQVIFELLMNKIRRTFIDLAYNSEQIELFFQTLQNNLEGFEEEAEQRLKESIVTL